MTRDEAKKKINIQKSEVYPYGIIDNVDSVIDEIFDSLEDRKCENCIFSYRFKNTIYDCHILEELDLPKDFYCKYWKPKYEKI